MRPIDAHALLKRWKYHYDHRDSLENCILTQPTINVEPVEKWIPCDGRLPEKGDTVLICLETRKVLTGWYSHDCWWSGFSVVSAIPESRVIAWMPLPNPPKMEETFRGKKGDKDDD